jgi:hypothetical protein
VLKKWLPDVHVRDEEINAQLEAYSKRQKRVQKRRKRPYFS